MYVSVRQKTKDMLEFIQDDDRLRDERKKAKKNKDKYIGMSAEHSTLGGGGGMGGYSEYNHCSVCIMSAIIVHYAS